MSKTLEELLAAPEASTPYPPIEAGKYGLKVADARLTESYVRSTDDREMSPKVRLQLHVTDGDNAGRSAFVTIFVDQDGRTFGFVKRLYRKLSGNGLLDGFNLNVVSNTVSNDEIAQQFAAGVVGGEMEARLGIRVNAFSGDEENIITRVY